MRAYVHAALSICAVLVFSTVVTLAFPQPAARAQEQGTTTASALPQVPAAKIDEIFKTWDSNESPGAVLAVIHDGQIVYQRGYGIANLELDVPLSPESVFYIASTSKQFTAACMALLARQGKVSLDDDVRKYITELPDYGTPITIRHLIHHTSGLRDYLALGSIAGRSATGLTTDDAVRVIVRQKGLNAAPGEEYSYTNSGYILLSAIIERVSGKTLAAFADEQIFQPLGMKHSLFGEDRSKLIKHRVTGYARAADGFRTDDAEIEATGDGNLWTTVGDLALWDQNFYDNRLGEGFTEELLTPGKLASGEPLDYAFGLVVDEYKGLRRVTHGGAFAGFRTQLVRFPDERLSVVCLANLGSMDPNELAMKVADLYLADRLAPEAEEAETSTIDLSDDALAAFAGAYRDPRSGRLFVFAVQDSALNLELPGTGQFRTRLQPTGESTFRNAGKLARMTCEFLPSQGDEPRQVRIQSPGGPPRTLVAATVASPAASELQDYVGTYYSPEVDATFTLSIEGDRLHLELPRSRKHTLVPGIRDEFLGSGVLQFERSADGRVTGFRFNAQQALGLQFNRQAEPE